MPSTIRDLTELTTVAVDDYFLVSDTSDTTNRDKRISQANMLGLAALRSGTPVAGRVASWTSATQVQDGGFAVTDIARLSQANTFAGLNTFSLNTTFNGFVVAPGGIRSYAVNIADDAINDFPLTSQGIILVTTNSGGANTLRYLMAAFRSNSGQNMTALFIGSDFQTSTATLTGTTGVDTKATISATPGHVFIENRLGSSIQFVVTLFL